MGVDPNSILPNCPDAWEGVLYVRALHNLPPDTLPHSAADSALTFSVSGTAVYANANDWGIGASAGVGVSVPIHANLRAFVETRYHLLFGTTAELPWIVPVTAGFRIGKVP